MNVHIGLPEFVSFSAMVVLFGFLWRSLSARWAETPFGKAMAFIY